MRNSHRHIHINTNPKQLFFDIVQLSWTVPLETGFWPRKHTFFLSAITHYPRLSTDWLFCQKTVKDTQPCVHAHRHKHTHPSQANFLFHVKYKVLLKSECGEKKIMYV